MSAYKRVISGAYDLWKSNGARLEAAARSKQSEAHALALDRERQMFEALCAACDEVRALMSARAAAAPVPEQTAPTGPEGAP